MKAMRRCLCQWAVPRRPRASSLCTTASATRAASSSFNVYTDGASRGNPGPAGAAAVVLDNRRIVLREDYSFLGGRHVTNNVAEYEGILLGLNAVHELCADPAHDGTGGDARGEHAMHVVGGRWPPPRVESKSDRRAGAEAPWLDASHLISRARRSESKKSSKSSKSKGKSDSASASAASKTLDGLVFVFTGEFKAFTRDGAMALVRRHGGAARTGVSGRTTHLVVGAKLEDGRAVEEGSKYRRATTTNAETCKVVTEAEFRALLPPASGATGAPPPSDGNGNGNGAAAAGASAAVAAPAPAAAAADASVVVHTDSQLIQKQLSGEWAVRDGTLRALHARCARAADLFGGGVRYVHVRRKHNARADALANAAIDRARDFCRVYHFVDDGGGGGGGGGGGDAVAAADPAREAAAARLDAAAAARSDEAAADADSSDDDDEK